MWHNNTKNLIYFSLLQSFYHGSEVFRKLLAFVFSWYSWQFECSIFCIFFLVPFCCVVKPRLTCTVLGRVTVKTTTKARNHFGVGFSCLVFYLKKAHFPSAIFHFLTFLIFQSFFFWTLFIFLDIVKRSVFPWDQIKTT